MIKFTSGASSVIIPSSNLGDPDDLEYPFVLGRQTTNALERYRDSNWPGKQTRVLQVALPKCHATYATYAELDAFLLANNGLSITMLLHFDTAKEEDIDVVAFFGTVEESLYYWHVQLITVEIVF